MAEFATQLALFCMFFIWAHILELVAHFLIHEEFTLFSMKKIKQPFNLLLNTVCAFSFLGIQATLTQYPAYFIFISALWITIHTDFRHMLISRWVSVYLAPIGIFLSAFNYLPLGSTESLLSCIGAATFLTIINYIFYMIKGHDGLGQGDIELLALIGAWIGAIGAWCTILIASTLGTVCGIIYILYTKHQVRILPFGPFLALGAYLYLQLSAHFTILW